MARREQGLASRGKAGIKARPGVARRGWTRRVKARIMARRDWAWLAGLGKDGRGEEHGQDRQGVTRLGVQRPAKARIMERRTHVQTRYAQARQGKASTGMAGLGSRLGVAGNGTAR